jgi:hypothetical protein
MSGYLVFREADRAAARRFAPHLDNFIGAVFGVVSYAD